ncbi:adenosine deaminase family protein [Oecophyllibacter saccharovorans]|uniref:adenosine deaminase family protein n=1 Tax=Oecophyllibacter saccharovorans TaxID=2558360 RepID=UPI001E3580F9|nr:adenosine deaminase [Oecophyllibacter saccharovorans]
MPSEIYCRSHLGRFSPFRLARLFSGAVQVRVMACAVMVLSFSHGVADAAPSLPDRSAQVSQVFENLRNDPVRLQMFLRQFPKGADLHNHLVGAVYAESLLRWAGEEGLCVSVSAGTVLPGSCDVGREGQEKATALPQDPVAWNLMVDALSMRDFVPGVSDRSGHDHFFGTFDRFLPLQLTRQGDMLAEARQHAADDHVHYVELMISPALGAMIASGHPLGLKDSGDLPTAHAALAPRLPALVAQARAEVDRMEERARQLLHCPPAGVSGSSQSGGIPPACRVQVRYLFQSVRTLPAAEVFAQLEAGYALVRADPRFVGLNIVAPEDNPVAVRDYGLQMAMFHFLNGVMPGVALSLHAGELTPALVPPAALQSHVWQAIETAGAQRIGHGVDVRWEKDPAGLLALMRRKHVLVEINLTSNQEILGVSGDQHPFRLYRQAGVPLALSTDDEGISRGSLTQEYQKAVDWFGLRYPDLVSLSRTGLEYAFLPGQSLWQDRQPGHFVPVCRQAVVGHELPQPCQALLKSSAKARAQWQLEEDLAAFEERAAREPLFNPGPPAQLTGGGVRARQP